MNKELLILAQYIDQARIRANSIESAAPQAGVYGDLSNALRKALGLLLDSDGLVDVAYGAILDGNTVAQAIKYAREAGAPRDHPQHSYHSGRHSPPPRAAQAHPLRGMWRNLGSAGA